MKTLMLFLMQIMLIDISYSFYCEQYVDVKFVPFSGVKIFSVIGGEGNKRGVIDLGHFNGNMVDQDIKIGTIEVDISMIENNKEKEPTYDFEIVNTEKLKDTIWNYSYDITPFISQKDNIKANIRLENLKISNGKGTIVFMCLEEEEHQHDNEKLKYSFDLILELRGLNKNGMYGISSLKKNEVSEAYVNFRDLVIDQLLASGVGNIK